MSPTEALAAVVEAGKTGHFYMTPHARDEAYQASATRYDVQKALATAEQATHQPSNGRWKIRGGVDLDGDELTLVVVFEGDVVVITVW